MERLRTSVEEEIRTAQVSLAQWQEVLADAQNAMHAAQQQIDRHQVDLKRLEWMLQQLGTAEQIQEKAAE